MSTAAALLGEWSLVGWQIEYPANGRTTAPFGEDAEGLLLYTAGGWMSAVVRRRQRVRFASARRSSIDEKAKAAAFDTYMHYAGRWRFVGETIHHEVLFAMNPVLEGTVQVRTVRLTDPLLVLEAHERHPGRNWERIHRLVWRRANDRPRGA